MLQSKFLGGARAATASTTLVPGADRVLSCYNASSATVTLPNPATMREDERGGPCFYVTRRAAGAVSVLRHDGSTLATLGAAGAVAIGLSASGYLVVTSGTVGVARSAFSSARGAITNAAAASPPQEDCFTGGDCGLADSYGNEPLDGQDGREEAVMPMVQDIVQFAKNAAREVVRSANFVMPSVVVVTLFEDSFSNDPSHPLAATTLSDAVRLAMWNGGNPHALEFSAADGGDSVVSRHPLHVRYWASSFGPSAGWWIGEGVAPLTVARRVWRKSVQYVTAAGAEHTLDIRFVAEYKLDGAKLDRHEGAWGAVFYLNVMTDELDLEWEDDDSYTPPGSIGDVSFTAADAVVSGVAFGQPNADASLVMFHPRMVASACLPTSYHAQLPGKWVPLNERRFGKVFEGGNTQRMQNLEYCYRRPAQSPFATPGNCADDGPAWAFDPFGVAAFGWQDLSATSGGTFTLGGDFEPRGRPLEFLVWWNGNASGGTYMTPSAPGWAADCGTLDVEGGSSGSVSLCTDDKYGVPASDGSGRLVWDDSEWSECAGHPAEPLEGIGGGHKCFNNGNSFVSGVRNCCVSIARTAIKATDQVKVTTSRFGSQNGYGCEPLAGSCEIAGVFEKTLVLEVEDYDYADTEGGDGELQRTISWARFLPSPDATYFNRTHAAGDGDFTTDVGTFSRAGASATVTAAVSPTTSPESLLSFRPAAVGSSPVGTACFSVTSDLANGDYATTVTVAAAGKHVIGSRMVSATSCVAAEIVPTGGSNATLNIVRWSSGTRTVLGSKNITTYSQPSSWTFKSWGAEYVLSGGGATLTAYDCVSSTWYGYPFVGGPVGASFSSIAVEDQNDASYLLEASASMSALQAQAYFDCGLHLAHDRRAYILDYDSTCGSCCEPPRCDCTVRSGQMIHHTTLSWVEVSEQRDIRLPNCRQASSPSDTSFGTSGDNPTVLGGELPFCSCEGAWCPPVTWYCGDCPFPFQSLSWIIPGRCGDDAGSELEPKMCRGFTRWLFTNLACL